MRKHWILALISISLIAGLVYLAPAVEVVSAQEQSTFSDDFSRDSGAWQYLGSASRDPTNQYIVLTQSSFQGGAVFFSAPIKGSFTASFRYKAGEGWSGDGFTMFFYKQKYTSLDDGGSLGFAVKEGYALKAVPGYGVEFDGWQNIPGDFQQVQGGQQNPQGDPTANHIALIKDFSGNHLKWVNDSRVSDNTWHKVTVEVQASSVRVFVDQNPVLEWSGTFDRTYDGFGFSGATGGGGSNAHIIDDVTVTSKNLQTASLTTTCITSVTAASFPVKIDGYLTFNGQPISGAPILLSYSVTGGDSWQDLTLTHTTADGSYRALWLLSVTGDYMLKAVYKGSEEYLGTSNTVSFSVAPCTDQNAFSVTSNSTLSQLSFSSSSKELSFSVSGDSGSTGYVNVYIPNTIVNDVSGLKVYLDSNPIDYTLQPVSDGWLLYATYHHSAHSVVVSLASSSLNPTSTQYTQTTIPTEPTGIGLDWVKIAILVFMVVFVAAVTVVAVLYARKKQREP